MTSPYYGDNPYDTIAPATDTRTVTLITDLLPLFKQHARITISIDDTLCNLYLFSAIRTIEQVLGMCIEPLAWDWTGVSSANNSYKLPFRNVVSPTNTTRTFSVEPLSAQQYMPPPTSWPVTLEVGFATLAEVPMDLQVAILHLATSLYENRGSYELGIGFTQDWVRAQLSRYYVPRV